MASMVGGIFALALMAGLMAAAGGLDRSISETIQETASCSLMQKESTGEVKCFVCAGTVCNASEDGWKILGNDSGQCIPTIEGCLMNSSINRERLAEMGFPPAINSSGETISSSQPGQWNAE